MFGFNKKKKIDLGSVSDVLARRNFKIEVTPDKNDVIVVHGRYRNNQKDFEKLYLHFVDEQVQFKDARGSKLQYVDSFVPATEMYSVLNDVMNIVSVKRQYA